jgi:hypothetical protein
VGMYFIIASIAFVNICYISRIIYVDFKYRNDSFFKTKVDQKIAAKDFEDSASQS